MCPAISANTNPVSIDQLDTAIVSCAAHINAATYELLVLVRQFDECAGFLRWGLDNCAQWLAWRCDLSLITRDNEQNLLDFALRTPASNVAQRCQELRMGDAASIDTVKRLCCDNSAVVLTETEKGEPLSIGRKSRIIPKAIERAVRARDNNHCRFPGCHHHRFLQCHHVTHWSGNGETSLNNLMLLCTKHHTLVHEGGFRIEADFQDNWCFMRPDGIAVPEIGYHARDMLDTETGEISSLYNKAPAGALLSAAENFVKEPPTPVYLH